MTRKKNALFSVITIGSHSIKMIIAEASNEKDFKVIENTNYPINLGRESFSKGIISVPVVLEVCNILNKLKKLLMEYRVTEFDVIATSAIREAKNRLFIIDKIMITTGLHVRILTNAEERYLTFKSIRKNYFLLEDFATTSSLFLDLGSGSISVSIYSKNKLTFSQNLDMGALRLYEETCELEEESTSYPVLLEEYTSSNIDRIINFGPHKRILRFFIFGNNAHFISSLCKPEKIYPKLSYVSREAFLDLYEKVKYMSSLEIMKKYNIGEDEIDLFFPSLVIVKGFLDLTISSGVYLTEVSLREGLMYNLLERNFNPEAQKEDYEDILSSARHIAKRFKYDKEHSREIEKFALEIFEAVKDAHELGNREKLLLQLACILHDTGKFLSYENHYKYSADIILALDLVGISEKDLNIVSACAKYHSHITPGENSYLFDKMKEEDKIVCAKLIAIIRIADALDRSHKGKFENIEVNYTKKEFTITGYSSEDTTLEEWVFTKKATFFAEVFGVMPELIIKGLLNYE